MYVKLTSQETPSNGHASNHLVDHFFVQLLLQEESKHLSLEILLKEFTLAALHYLPKQRLTIFISLQVIVAF